MTIQSLAWALDQPIPGTAKLVLMGLANYTDDATGEVHFDAAAVSRIAVVKEASLWRYLGALERNGYLDKTEEGSRKYWLLLDRESQSAWSWSAEDLPAETESQPSPAPAPRRRDNAPSAFSKARQAEAREVVAAPKSDAPPDQVPVIEGTDASRAWIAHDRSQGKVPPFMHALVLKSGQNARGFYKPTLFPPRQDRIENLEGAA